LGLRSEISSLIQTWQPDLRQMSLQKIQSATQLSEFASLQPAVQALTQAEAALSNEATQWKLYVPKFVWYGTQNQYHHWLARFLQFDLGLSYLDNRPIATKLSEALTWTLVISFCSILLTYLVSIPIGIYSAYRRNTLGDRISTTTLFILYSLPSFWIAILLLMFFSNPDYFNWFPAGGVQDILATDDCPLSYRILDWVSHLVLPVLVSTYASFAFISRQMRVGMLDALGQDYVRTARAKGLDERTVVWKHALRNSLIPIITLFASVFPALVGGSVIIETIFSIPGMGYESYKAIMTRDYPVIVAVFTLSGSLTLVGILVADVLYAVVDPRISFTKK
jgi:peptide/nickel transport system permease protein